MAQKPPLAGTTPLGSVLYMLGWLTTMLAGAMLVPTYLAVAAGQDVVAAAFAASALGSAFLGGGLLFAMQGAQRPARMRENLLLVVGAWLTLPILAGIPFLGSGAVSNFTDAYFEAMSALTTTGASVIASLDEQSSAIILWRALLQWIGGFASIIMATAVLSALGTAGLDVQRTRLPLGHEGPLLARFLRVTRSLFALYCGASGLGWMAMWFSGISGFEALCLTLSAISTGGFAPTEAGITAVGSVIGRGVLSLLMLFGAMNFMAHWQAWRRGPRVYAEAPEMRYLLAAALAGLVLFGADKFHALDGLARLGALGPSLFNAISLVTTTGFWIGTHPQDSAGFVLGAIILALIGGATVSTAGGIKLMRIALLVAQSGGELKRLSHPRSIIRVRYQDRTIDQSVMLGIWTLFIVYLGAFALAGLGLAWFDLGLVQAMAASAAGLANVGPLFTLATGAADSYVSLPASAKWLLAVVMAAGRLEVLALLSLLSRFHWVR